MNKIAKIVAAVVLGSVLVGNAFAVSNMTYGVEKAIDKTKAPNDSQVLLYNHTNDTYVSHAIFEPTGSHFNNSLGYYGSKTDTITYSIVSPDDEVCLKVEDVDGYIVYNDCVYSGSIYIEPGKDAKRPIVHVSR